MYDGALGWQRQPTKSRAMSLEMARKAVDLDKEDEFSHTQLGLALLFAKRHEEAIQRLRTAIKLNPNISPAMGGLGMVLVYTRQHEEGLECLHKAMQLSPKDLFLQFYVLQTGFSYFIEERYDEARMWAEKALHENPNLPGAYRLLVSAHGMLDNLDEARAALEQFGRLAPGVTIAATLEAVPFAYEDEAERFAEGLRRAGMPEE